jgi:hypothetical protein
MSHCTSRAGIALALVAAFTADVAMAQDAGAGASAGDAGSGGDAGGDGGGDGGAAAFVSPASNALVAIRRSEPRTEIALSLGASVVDAPARVTPLGTIPHRDGLQRGALELEGSWAPSPRWELFATVNAMAFRWLVVGGTEQRQLTFGSTTVGSTWVPVSLPGGRLDAGLFLRVLAPTSQEVNGVHVWGVQPGLTFRGVATRWLAWFGGASFRVTQTWGSITTGVTTRSADQTQTGMSAMLGIAFVPASWLRVVAQFSGNLPFGLGSDQLSPGLGFRFVNGPLAAEIGASVPLLGQARTFNSMARVSWRFDR